MSGSNMNDFALSKSFNVSVISLLTESSESTATELEKLKTLYCKRIEAMLQNRGMYRTGEIKLSVGCRVTRVDVLSARNEDRRCRAKSLPVPSLTSVLAESSTLKLSVNSIARRRRSAFPAVRVSDCRSNSLTPRSESEEGFLDDYLYVPTSVKRDLIDSGDAFIILHNNRTRGVADELCDDICQGNRKLFVPVVKKTVEDDFCDRRYSTLIDGFEDLCSVIKAEAGLIAPAKAARHPRSSALK